jgi:prepilin-type N-terminal cleavage/methylation domain-containing protein
MNRQRQRTDPILARRAAFTLIELLVVILVILILAGLMLKGGQYFRQAALERQAHAEMTAIANAIGAWATDNGGGLPTSITLCQALLFGPKKYLDWPAARIQPSTGTGLLDPWGGQYTYEAKSAGGNHVLKNQSRAFVLETSGSRYKLSRTFVSGEVFGSAPSNPN